MSFVATDSITDQRGKLLLISPNGQIFEELVLEQSNNIIGRSKSCEIVIDNENISREHARILYTPEGFFVCDLGSTNGTFLNGYLVKPNRFFKLGINDRIDLGGISFVFQLEHRIVEQRKPNTIHDKENDREIKVEVKRKKNPDLEIKDFGLTFKHNQDIKLPEDLNGFIQEQENENINNLKIQEAPSDLEFFDISTTNTEVKEPEDSTIRFGSLSLEKTEQEVGFHKNSLSTDSSYYFPQANLNNKNQEFLLDFEEEQQAQEECNSFEDFKYKLSDSQDFNQFVENQHKSAIRKVFSLDQVFSNRNLLFILFVSFALLVVFYFKFRPAFG